MTASRRRAVLTLGGLLCALTLGACATTTEKTRGAEPGAAIVLPGTPLSALEMRLIEDAQDRHLDQLDLLQAAIIASGAIEPAELARQQRFLRARLDDASAALADGRIGPGPAGARVLSALHSLVLGRYQVDATTMTDLVDRDRYNCVTATILYNILAEEQGLIVKAVVTPSHVFSVVFTAEGAVEVETTSAVGYAPDRSEGSYLRFLAERGLAAGTPAMGAGDANHVTEAEQADEIDDIALVSLILSNRGVEAMGRGDPERAYDLFRRARRLSTADRAMQLRVHESALANDLALRAAEAGAFAQALGLIDMVRDGAPATTLGVLMHNRAYCVIRQADTLLAAERYDEAVAALDAGVEVDPAREDLHHARLVAYNRWGTALAEAARFADSEAVYLRGVEAETDSDVLDANLAAVRYNWAVAHINAQRCDLATPIIDRGLRARVRDDAFRALREGCAGKAAQAR